MSFVEQVLLAAGSQEIDTTHINERIPEIQREIDRLKQEIREFIINKYSKVQPDAFITKNQDVVKTAKEILDEINLLQKCVDEQIKVKFKESSKKLQTLSDSLKELKLSLTISSQLLEVHKYRLAVKNAEKYNQHVEAAEMLRKMHEILFKSSTDMQSLDIIDVLKLEYSDLHSHLCSSICSLWERNVQLKEKVNQANVNKMFLTRGDELESLIKAMHHISGLDKCVLEFCTTLQTLFIKPIVSNDCNVFIENNKNVISQFAYVLTLEIVGKITTFNAKQILYNLKLLFRCLTDYFKLTLPENEHFLSILRDFLYPQLKDTLIHDVVKKMIPTSSTELQAFAAVKEDIVEFENEMINCGFIFPDAKYLTDYIMDVDNLSTQKIRQSYIIRAREIMKKDLHESVKYFPRENFEIPQDILDNYTLTFTKQTLESSTFQLPACQISKSTKELMHLIEELLDQTCGNTDEYTIKLFYTSRDIIDMYMGVVPLHHKQFLETIPQQVALFHNNCMYLAHHLLTLAYKYEVKFPTVIQKYNLIYADQVLLLRSLGVNYFLRQMRYQRDVIHDIIRDSGLSKIGESSKLPEDTEKTLRQCIRQLELLKTVWLHILPENVYCRAIGCIMSAMVKELIIKVTSVEDISADVATDLVNLYNVVIRRAPAIFPETQDIHNHVTNWTKLKELIIILGASLKEIEERWALGNGPLAREFSAEHVKQLIKALFQNTDRRSALLSKIK